MPAVRQPLRERCNIQFNVETTIPAEISYDTFVYDEGTPLHECTRYWKPIPDVSVPYTRLNKKKLTSSTPSVNVGPHLHPLDVTTMGGLQSLHQLVPYIFVGFHTGKYLPQSLITTDGTAFTHIVKITHETEKRGAGATELQVDVKRGLHSLVLVVPAPSAMKNIIGKRRKSLLSKYQMLTARDFLSLALPYYSEAHPRDDLPATSADSVRILITAPAGVVAASDVMAIAICYLTYASEESAATVFGYIRAEEEVPCVWKESADEGEEAFIDMVAKMGE